MTFEHHNIVEGTLNNVKLLPDPIFMPPAWKVRRGIK